MLALNALVVGPSRTAVVTVLRRAGVAEFAFAAADTGSAGLAAFDPAVVQIVFAADRLPDMPAAEFARRLREPGTNRHVPLVLVGGDPAPVAGANARLAEPLAPDDVTAALAPLLAELERITAPKHGSWFAKLFA